MQNSDNKHYETLTASPGIEYAKTAVERYLDDRIDTKYRARAVGEHVLIFPSSTLTITASIADLAIKFYNEHVVIEKNRFALANHKLYYADPEFFDQLSDICSHWFPKC